MGKARSGGARRSQGGKKFLDLSDHKIRSLLGHKMAAAFHHAAFEVAAAEDLDGAAAALEARGVDVVENLDLPHKRSLFVRDPDGTALEFFIRRGGGFDALEDLRGAPLLFAA